MITAGAGNTLWFTENSTGPGGGVNVGAISTGGSAANYTPSPVQSGLADGIVQGPDGNYYFTEITSGGSGAVGDIVKATPSGAFTQYTIPTAAESSSYEGAIVVGPDHNLWFTVPYANKIGVMTTSGAFTLYTLPHSNSEPYGITVGADGNLWFTEAQGDRIGRITTAGVITEYNVPTAYAYPEGIAADAAGNVWFAEEGADKIGRLTASGVFSEYSVSGPPGSITIGPDGHPWFTEGSANKIGTLDPTMPPDLPASINPNCGCPNMPGSVNVTSAAAIGPIVNEFTSAPVRYGDGVVDIAETDLYSAGFGDPWGQTRSWTNGTGYATGSDNGNGWVDTYTPRLLQADGADSNILVLVSNGTTASYYTLVNGAYQAGFDDPSRLTYNSGADTYTLVDGEGDQIVFTGFGAGRPVAQRGEFASDTDAAGVTMAVTSYTSNGNIAEMQRSSGGVTDPSCTATCRPATPTPAYSPVSRCAGASTAAPGPSCGRCSTPTTTARKSTAAPSAT